MPLRPRAQRTAHPVVTAFALCLVLALAIPGVAGADLATTLAAGDEAWAERAEAGIIPSIKAYRKAVAARPTSLEARWKLLRSIYYQGEFLLPEDRRLETYDKSLELAEATLDLLVQDLGGRERFDEMSVAERTRALQDEPEAAPVLFWAAVHWGLWGENTGVFKAARQGIGSRIRDLSETVVALDPSYEDAGGDRMLGRLHAIAPKIPFFTSWIDRDVALRHLRRAWSAAPEEPYNGLYLAEAIFEHDADHRAEALEVLRDLARRSPRPDHRVEDAAILAQARELLESES